MKTSLMIIALEKLATKSILAASFPKAVKKPAEAAP